MELLTAKKQIIKENLNLSFLLMSSVDWHQIITVCCHWYHLRSYQFKQLLSVYSSPRFYSRLVWFQHLSEEGTLQLLRETATFVFSSFPRRMWRSSCNRTSVDVFIFKFLLLFYRLCHRPCYWICVQQLIFFSGANSVPVVGRPRQPELHFSSSEAYLSNSFHLCASVGTFNKMLWWLWLVQELHGSRSSWP